MGILKNGFKTLVTFSQVLFPDFYGEVEVTPPGTSARGGIPQSTMRNILWTTQLPKGLKELQPLTMKVAYDTRLIPVLMTLVGVNQRVTIRWPDGATLSFWGWIDEATFDSMTEDNRPIYNLSVQTSNVNAACVESGPVFVEGSESICAV